MWFGCLYTKWLPVQSNSLPYIIWLSITRRVLVSLLNASSISTRLDISPTRMYPLAKHAFHICWDSIPLHKPRFPTVRSILHLDLTVSCVRRYRFVSYAHITWYSWYIYTRYYRMWYVVWWGLGSWNQLDLTLWHDIHDVSYDTSLGMIYQQLPLFSRCWYWYWYLVYHICIYHMIYQDSSYE